MADCIMTFKCVDASGSAVEGACLSIDEYILSGAIDHTKELDYLSDEDGIIEITAVRGAKIKFSSNDIKSFSFAGRTITVPSVPSFDFGNFVTDLNPAMSKAGTPFTTGVTAREIGSEACRKTILTLENVEVAMTDNAGVVAYGGIKIYDISAGYILHQGSSSDLVVGQISKQLETATVTAAAGVTGDGDLIVTVTGADLESSPIDITVPLTTDQTTAALIAAEIIAALEANEEIAAAYEIGGSGATVTLLRTSTDGPDSSLNIDINADDPGTTATGITNAATSANTYTGINANWDGDFSLGTVTASSNATLSSTEQNLIPSTATPQASGGETSADGVSTTTEIAIHDGHTTPIDVFLNFLIDDADHNIGAGASKLVVNGTVCIVLSHLGDN